MTTSRNIPFGKPILGTPEKEAVWAVLESGMLAHGKHIIAFEEAFADFTPAPHAVGLSSCTAAMHLCYLHWGIGPGDEVVVPAMTHVATAHAVEYVGATPVFVDADATTGNVSAAAIEAAITPKTKAIAIVHFLGYPVDMPAMM